MDYLCEKCGHTISWHSSNGCHDDLPNDARCSCRLSPNDIMKSRITALEQAAAKEKNIAETIFKVSASMYSRQSSISCPHGTCPSYPTHAWWCDKCFYEWQDSITELARLLPANGGE